MEAKDLRIGNTVLKISFAKSRLDPNRFHPITVDGNDIAFCSISSESFKPIPLTEEWLIKMGSFYDGVCFRLQHGDRAVQCFQFIIEKDGVVIRIPGRTLTKFKYVHQLQNLYHALTGEELTINKIEL